MQAAGGLKETESSIVEALKVVGCRTPTATALVWRDSLWSYTKFVDAVEAVRRRLTALEPAFKNSRQVRRPGPDRVGTRFLSTALSFQFKAKLHFCL
ncbi:MAG: hypothetical protein L0H63_04130 [Nitrococcus sp.]|nr:hypothetical protein [Nitrococcus sp.]